MKRPSHYVVYGLLTCNSLLQAETDKLPNTSVEVSVKAPAQESELASFVKRELRALHDVDIVETNAQYHISLIMVPSSSTRGDSLGYAVSVLIDHSPSRRAWSLMFTNRLNQSEIKWIEQATESMRVIDKHQLRLGGRDDLKLIATQIIADFDTEFLERDRQLMRRFLNELQKIPSPAQTSKPPQ